MPGGHVIRLLLGCALQTPQPPAEPVRPAAPVEPVIPETMFGLWAEQVDGWLSSRYRAEIWSLPHGPADPDPRYEFSVARVRAGLSMDLDPMDFALEVQQVGAFGLPRTASLGPGSTYFTASDADHSPQQLSIRQLWMSLPIGDLHFRVGRQLLEDGGGVEYRDEAFQFVRDRGQERLIGLDDWVGGGRSFDGIAAEYDTGSTLVEAYAAAVNAGSFAVNQSPGSLDDHQVAGLEITARRSRLVPATEVRLFALAIRDRRPIVQATSGDDIFVGTLGFQTTTQVDVGVGRFDALLWMAWQGGENGIDRQRSLAYALELGYQVEDMLLSPWLRVGRTQASGDHNANDATNHNFYNGVPGNHRYYGILDQFALSNLRNHYVELILRPAPQARVVLTYHDFNRDDRRAAVVTGGGAFAEDLPAYNQFTPASGSRNLGQEIDLVAEVELWEGQLQLAFGYAHFFGGRVFQALFNQDDASLTYLQVGLQF